jgi:hypothetical protein
LKLWVYGNREICTNQQELDADEALKEQVRDAADTLLEALTDRRSGRRTIAGSELRPPRDK